MWCIKGRIVPLASDHSVATTMSATFAGRVWIADDGTVAAVTRGSAAGPAGSTGARVVDVGSSLVIPGLVDLHNHLAYNTLPLWTEPTRSTPWPHHNAWTRAPSYAASTTWPAYALITACPEELLAFVETRALVGGTTTIQGSPPMNKPRDGWMVRNVEDETFGTGDPNRVYASVLTLKGPALAARANAMRTTPTRVGSTFIYHCAEGQPGSIVAREFTDAASAGCLQPNFVAVHANAVSAATLDTWSSPGAIAWSPFSNLWLYGTTTDIPAARAAGVSVCLGSDWGPSGTKHVLGEAKAAKAVADQNGWDLTDQDLVEMMTANPGDVLARSWGRQIGRLQPGAIADIVVIAAAPRARAFSTIVAATETDVQLVVVGGKPLYGTASLMSAAKATPVTSIAVAGQSRRLALSRPATVGATPAGAPWTWTSVNDRIDAVRADPASAVRTAQNALAPWAGRLDQVDAPLRLSLDMPTGLAPVGGLPKDLGDIVVPPPPTLWHDADFFAAVAANPFHGGVLDAMARYYS